MHTDDHEQPGLISAGCVQRFNTSTFAPDLCVRLCSIAAHRVIRIDIMAGSNGLLNSMQLHMHSLQETFGLAGPSQAICKSSASENTQVPSMKAQHRKLGSRALARS